jgi:hypothetical protein
MYPPCGYKRPIYNFNLKMLSFTRCTIALVKRRVRDASAAMPEEISGY